MRKEAGGKYNGLGNGSYRTGEIHELSCIGKRFPYDGTFTISGDV
jgi:hypothetical protein